MEMIIDLLCHGLADAVDALEIGQSGPRDAARGAEVMEQRALAPRADAGDLVERRLTDCLGSLGSMGADREAMGFVPQALQEIEYRILRIETEGRFAGNKQAL